MEIEWICPKCGVENWDDWELSAFPLCEGCDETNWWEDFLSEKELDKYISAVGKIPRR